jgi:SAM-dependent methyltransferase
MQSNSLAGSDFRSFVTVLVRILTKHYSKRLEWENTVKTTTVIPYRPGIRDEHEELLQDFVRLLHEAADKDFWCLDIGTGTGRIAFELAPKVRWVLGVDKNARLIEAARRRAQNEGITNVQFIMGNLESLSFEDLAPTGVFQLVATNLYLTDEVLCRLPAAMEAGSRLVGTCFDTNQWRETGHVMDYSYTEDRLQVLLRANGFSARYLETHSRIVQFENIDQVAEEYLPARLVHLWHEDGRWTRLEKEFAAGRRTLTESKLVFSAGKV